MNSILRLLKPWYEHHHRKLPWRNTTNAYYIWLSEIILQQTRVEQGLPYYTKLVDAFPDINQLAEAKEDLILKLWQGLGYYSRARNMHFTAREIVKKYNGVFPDDFSEIKKLKGIGEYTAAAIASFAFNKPHAVVDGNVYRFLSRFFGIKTPVNSSKGKKKFKALAEKLLDRKNPAMHNQAIMEFGALQCKPFPDCKDCPLNADCYAFKKNKVKQLPVKNRKQLTRARHFNYLVIKLKNKILIQKRIANDIWKNLYQFPLIETPKKIMNLELMKTKEWKLIFGKQETHIQSVSRQFKHQLSHQTIYACFLEVEVKNISTSFFKKNFILINKNKIQDYAVPKLIEKYILENKI